MLGCLFYELHHCYRRPGSFRDTHESLESLSCRVILQLLAEILVLHAAATGLASQSSIFPLFSYLDDDVTDTRAPTQQALLKLQAQYTHQALLFYYLTNTQVQHYHSGRSNAAPTPNSSNRIILYLRDSCR